MNKYAGKTMSSNTTKPSQTITLDGPDWQIATDLLNIGRDQKWFDSIQNTSQTLGSAELSERWTVFELAEKTDTEPSAGQLLELPKTLTVGGVMTKPHEFTIESGRLDLGELLGWREQGKIAYVYIPFTVREDGLNVFGIGADWWHKAWIDGEVISDTLATGNGGFAKPTMMDHVSKVQLRKGEHLLVLKFISGSASAVLVVGGPSHVRPLVKLQEKFLRWRFGLFIHFGMATFHDLQWATGHEDPASFAPTKLDCGQWADAAREAGMTYAILTVKHTSGWCLWQSDTTTHGMQAFTNYHNGKGDLAREFVDAFRARGMKVGFYYCLPGNYVPQPGLAPGRQQAMPTGKPNLLGLPPEALNVDRVEFMKKQFTELLTRYGQIDEIWLDQGWDVKWALKEHIKSIQPNCVVLLNNDLGDVAGIELAGVAGLDKAKSSVGSIPTEVADCITPEGYWFWQKVMETNLLTAAEIVDRVTYFNVKRANYLLDVPPDMSGQLPPIFVELMKEVGTLLKASDWPAGAWNGTLAADSTLTPAGLRCEYRQAPLGIDEPKPRLSWRLASSDPAARGQRQTAYQVLVASSRQALDNDQGDLWDSGMISGQANRCEYAGKPLTSRLVCHWKVRAWDQDGKVSAWSAPARWTMGLLRPEDWTAKWILEDENPPDSEPVAPLFRKTFDLSAAPVRATVYVSSLGYHELYLNGQKVGEAVLAPQVSLMDRYVFYTTHDVSRLVQAGANCVGLWLGDGYVSRFFPYSKPQGIVQLEIECRDGSLVTVSSDETWRTRPSHLRRIGRFVWGDYGGERWDGTQELPDWCKVTADDSGWQPARVRTGGTPTRREALETDLPDRMRVETPAATPVLRAQAIPPTVVLQKVEPRAVQKEPNQTWLVDMGRVVTGWFAFTGQGTAGQAVTVYYMQSLLDDAEKPADGDPTLIGLVSQDLVDPDAGGCVRFCNKFNYHTFRYIRIKGLTQVPSASQTKAMILGTGLEPAFSFACSNDVANRIHQASLNTLMANSIGGYIADCPDRERAAYAGYSLVYASLLMQHYADGIVFLEKTVRDAVDAQRADGLPATCSPVGPGGGSGLWTHHSGGGHVFIRTPWQLYLNSGDKRAMEMARTAAEKYLLAMPRYFDDKVALVGISQWEFLGDWYAFGVPGDTSGFNPLGKAIQGNCLYILSLDRMSKILDAFGETEQAVRYRAKADEQRRLFHANYYGKDAANYGLDHMSYLAEPLLAQVPPKEEEDAVFRALEHNIRMVAKGHPHSGDGGMHHLMEVLLACNRPDLVYLMVNQTERPSWGAMIMNGDETIWEHWTEVHSKSHVGVGGIGEWFLNGLAGIQCDPARPGFRHAVVRPYFPPDMEWLSASSVSVQGRIAVSWRKQDGTVTLEVSIPPNTTATLVLPVGRPEDIAESGKPLDQAPGIAVADTLNSETALELGSGNFGFSWRL